MKKRRAKLGGIVLVAAAFLCAVFAYALTRSPVFAGEGYELSLGGSSSARIIQTQDPALVKFFTPVAGESARWAGDVHGELIARFSAEVLFTETSCGVIHYYCHSPMLGAGVALGGRTVNLHIAVGNGRTAAGTPVIFGGC